MNGAVACFVGRIGTRTMIAGAFAIGAGLAACALAALGINPRGISDALRATARWSFLPFWLAYASGPAAGLFGARLAPFAARVRDFGLAYAAAQLVHAGLVAWLYAISPKPPVPFATLIFFGVGLFWTYLLALLSARRIASLLNPSLVWLLRQVGALYIMLAFLHDFAIAPFRNDLGFQLLYAPFFLLCIGGIAMWAANAVLRTGMLVKWLLVSRSES
jgi:hypothetical protein